MKKWAAFLLCIMAVFVLAAAANAEGDPEAPYIHINPAFAEPGAGEPFVPLWESVYFDVDTNMVHNGSIRFYYNYTDNDPGPWIDVGVDDMGYGQAWFTPGTSDVDPFHTEELYNADNMIQRYTAQAAVVEFDNEGNENFTWSNEIAFTTGLTDAADPRFSPTVTNKSSGSLRRDSVFTATVSNEPGFRYMDITIFEIDDQGNPAAFAVDSHWIGIDENGGDITIEVPLLRLEVNKQYIARLYGLRNGSPMSFYEPFDTTFRVISPASSGDSDTEILIGNLRNGYETGELIMPTVYYPGIGGDDQGNTYMDICIFAPQNAEDPDRWDFNRRIWQDDDGSIYYQPEEWDNPASCWSTGDYIFQVKVWHEEENGQPVLVDSVERTIAISGIPYDFDPNLPAYIDRSQLPYEFSFVRPDADFYWVRIESGDDHDWDADPDYDSLICEFDNWSDPAFQDEPQAIIIPESVHQRVHIIIDAGKAGCEWYHLERSIPIYGKDDTDSFSLWTDPGLADEGENTAEPLPVNFNFPVRIQAPGANWIRLENIYGQFAWIDNPDEINDGNPIERTDSIREAGVNYILATVHYTDDEGTGTEKQQMLILHGEAYGDAGPFTASIDKKNVSRGDTAVVTYTKSENADHYWVDLEVWNPDWNNWQGYERLADLYVEGENNGGTAVLNTTRLEPNTYRLCARAEGLGYYAAEYVITDEFIVSESALPVGEIRVNVSEDHPETNEEFTLSAFAPGANQIEVYWNGGNADWDWRNNCGGESGEWRCGYGHSGTYQIVVRAWYTEYDENGNPVWAIDEETGEIHVDGDGNPDWPQQYNTDRTVEMNVTAPNGAIELTLPDTIPATLTENELYTFVSFEVEKPDHAEWVNAEAWTEGEGAEWHENFNIEDGADTLPVQFAIESLRAGQEVHISIHAGARGYENADVELRIPVIQGGEASNLVVLHMSETDAVTDKNGKLYVRIGGHIEFLVSAAEGHTLTAVKFFGPRGWWEGGQEINHENHGDWFRDEGNTAFFNEDFWDENLIGCGIPVYAMARIDGKDTWYCSEVQTYYLQDYQIGRYDFTSKDPVTVARGENAVFTFTAAQDADDYWVDAWSADNDEWSWNPQTSCSGTSVTLNTIQLPEGEYTIRGRAGADGKGWRESDGEVRLIVTEGAAMEGEALLTLNKTEAQTMEEISATFIAPGADWVEIIRRHEGGWEDDFAHNWNGDGVEGSFNEDFERNVEVFGRAHFFARDNEGNTIPAYDESGNEYNEELDWLESEHVTVTITAPNGVIEQDASGIPVSAVAGEPLRLCMNKPAEAVSMGWQLYLNRDFDNDEQQPDIQGNDSFDITIEARDLFEGNTVELRVWIDGEGYEHNHQNYDIPVLAGTEDRVTLAVTENDVLVREFFTVTVTAPGAERIRYDNGNGMWTQWDDQEQQEVPQEMELDDNDQWIHEQDYDNSGVQTLRAWALINGEWVASDPVRVTVRRIGHTGVPALNPGNVTAVRGDIVTLTYTEADHANAYDLHHDRIRGNDDGWIDYELRWNADETGHRITILTAGMPEGEYRLWLWAGGEPGYEGQDSREVLLTVTEPQADEVGLQISRSSVKTMEDIPFSVYAPGANRIEIHWKDDDVWGWDGSSSSGSYRYSNTGTYQVFARAYYPDNENDYADSDLIAITVTSNGQQVPIDLSSVPRYLTAGEDATITVPWTDGADMCWEIYTNRDFDNNEQQPDYSSYNDRPLNQVIPGNELSAGNTLQLKVWADAFNYDHNHQELRIPIISAAAAEPTFEVSSSSILTCQPVSVTVTFPEGTYTKIQLFDGENYLGEENLEGATTWEWKDDNAIGFGIDGEYTLYARLWEVSGNKWVYTESKTVTVTAPNGPIAYTPTVPAGIYTGQDATFTLANPVVQGEEIQLNYELYDETENDQIVSWEDPKDNNQITIPKDKIFAGHRYRLNYNAFAEGYEPVNGYAIITAYTEPVVTLAVDKNTITYGETVTFLVNAPNADEGTVCVTDENGTPISGFTWTPNEPGVFRFGAKAAFNGAEVTTGKPVTVTVRSLGPAPAPEITAPDEALAGNRVTMTITSEGGSDVDYQIMKDGAEFSTGWISAEEPQRDITIIDEENALAGEYTIVLSYSKTGYDTINTGKPVKTITVYGEPTWEWTGFTRAKAVFEAGSTRKTVKAEIAPAVMVTEPTCGAEGLKTYTATVTFLGQEFTDSKDEVLEMAEHEWDEPEFSWIETENGYSVTATFTCLNDQTHVRNENADVVALSHEAATCTEPETTVYEASAEGWNDRKTVKTGEAAGHGDWSGWTFIWDDDTHASAERTCGRCGRKETADSTNIEINAVTVKEATCTAKGKVTYTATLTLDGETAAQDTRTVYTPKAEHTPGAPVTDEETGLIVTRCTVCEQVISSRRPYTAEDFDQAQYTWSEDNSTVTGTHVCTMPGDEHTETEKVRTTSAVTQAASCTQRKIVTYTAVFTQAGFETQTKNVEGKYGHNLTAHEAKDPTCEEPGNTAYWECTECHQYFSDKDGENSITADSWITNAALGHKWGKAKYEWSADNKSVTARHVCGRAGCGTEETETVNTTEEVTKPATCEGKGKTTYTADFMKEGFTDKTKTVADIDPLGHAWGEPTYALSADGSEMTAKHTCTREGCDEEETETADTEADYTGEGAKAPTCTEGGVGTFTAEFTKQGFDKTTLANQAVDPLGHDWEVSYAWTDDNSKVVATAKCSRGCNEPDQTEEAPVASAVTQEPTCTKKGKTTYTTAEFENDLFTKQEKVIEDVAALGHSMKATAAKAATCTAAGNSAYWTCDTCGKYFSDADGKTEIAKNAWVIAAMGHSWKTPTYAWASDNSAVTAKQVCARDSSHVISEKVATTYKVTKKATYTAVGTGLYTSKAFTKSTAFKVQTKKITIDMLPRTAITKAKIKAIDDQVYTGSAIKPALTIKYNKKKLVKGTDYTVSFKNNVKPGQATVTITGKNAFKGKTTVTFTILPKKVKLESVKPGKAMLTVTWKKGAAITGYEIEYSLKKTFSKAKTVKVTTAATVKTKIKKLTPGKTYYVRIRAYKKVGSKMYYSDWSDMMKAKVPKQ